MRRQEKLRELDYFSLTSMKSSSDEVRVYVSIERKIDCLQRINIFFLLFFEVKSFSSLCVYRVHKIFMKSVIKLKKKSPTKSSSPFGGIINGSKFQFMKIIDKIRRRYSHGAVNILS